MITAKPPSGDPQPREELPRWYSRQVLLPDLIAAAFAVVAIFVFVQGTATASIYFGLLVRSGSIGAAVTAIAQAVGVSTSFLANGIAVTASIIAISLILWRVSRLTDPLFSRSRAVASPSTLVPNLSDEPPPQAATGSTNGKAARVVDMTEAPLGRAERPLHKG